MEAALLPTAIRKRYVIGARSFLGTELVEGDLGRLHLAVKMLVRRDVDFTHKLQLLMQRRLPCIRVGSIVYQVSPCTARHMVQLKHKLPAGQAVCAYSSGYWFSFRAPGIGQQRSQ